MKNITKFGIVALLLVSLVAAGAFAFRGMDNEAAKEAIETGDYSGWKSAMESGLTEERFNQICEKHGQREEHRLAMQESKESMQAALEAGDFEAWSAIVGETRPQLLEKVTAENFDSFRELHLARQEGDLETVNQIVEELGLENKLGRMGYHKFGRRGFSHT